MDGVVLVSACLLGVACRYDGRTKNVRDISACLAGFRLIPACPEQLGGLPTPRPPATIYGGDGLGVLEGTASVIDAHGRDVTRTFVRGASETALLAHKLGARRCLLKGQSPSCGLTPCLGVTAARLLVDGLLVEEVS